MITDADLDAALGQLGPPAGAQPQADAAAILARARLFAPPPPPRPRFLAPAVGLVLLAAGLVVGVGVGRYSAPTTEPVAPAAVMAVAVAVPVLVPVFVPQAAPAPLLQDAGSPQVSALPVGRRVVRDEGALPSSAVVSPSMELAAIGSAALPAPQCATEPDERATTPDTRELDELLAEETPSAALPVEDLEGESALPTSADRRLQRPERVPREPGDLPTEADVVVDDVAALEPQTGAALPLDLRLVVAGGAAPGLDPRAGAEGSVGLAWRPTFAGFSRPEVSLDAGVGGWSGQAGVDWTLQARLGAGLVLGEGFLRGAVDWSVAASAELDQRDHPPPDSPDSMEEKAPFGTGPALAVVLGRDAGARVRLGGLVDFAPHGGGGAAPSWELRPEAFVALEVPLGRRAAD